MAALMLCSAATFAQHAVGSFTLQPKVGINIANLTDLDADSRVDFVGGVEGEYQVSDIFSLSAGLLYSRQGAKWEGQKGEFLGFKYDTGDVKVSPSYLNIPILANVYVAKGLAVKAGIQPGFCVDDDNTGAKSFDFSIPVGLSYEYSNFVLDARYNWGVTKVFENADPKNSVFQITLGYKFDL